METAGYQFDLGKMFGAMSGDRVDRNIVIEAVRAARARGLRIGLLTNNVKEFGDDWRGQFPIDELFDEVVDSSHEGMRKPDREIYFTALERLGVANPAHAVFLDDFEGNVIAARNLGMHGIVVGDDPRDALDELRRAARSRARLSGRRLQVASAFAFAWAS